jgi:hypothetical protein
VIPLSFEQFGRSRDDLLGPRRAHALTLYSSTFLRPQGVCLRKKVGNPSKAILSSARQF